MSKIIFGVVSLLWFGSLSGGQEQTQSSWCPPSPGIRDYNAWYQSTGLSSGRRYRISARKKDYLRNEYAKLELGMSRSEARKLLGTPDFEQRLPEAIMRVPTSKCKYQWAYILSKNDANMADPNDVAIYLSFSSDDRLIWKSPQNMDLKPIGSPTAK